MLTLEERKLHTSEESILLTRYDEKKFKINKKNVD